MAFNKQALSKTICVNTQEILCILFLTLFSLIDSKAQSFRSPMQLDSIDFSEYRSYQGGNYKWKSRYTFSDIRDTLFVVKKRNENAGFRIDYTKKYVQNNSGKWTDTYNGYGNPSRSKYFTDNDGLLIKQTVGNGKNRKTIEYQYANKILEELKISYENGQEFYKDVKLDEFGRITELGCRRLRDTEVDTCLSDRTYSFNYSSKEQVLPSTIIKKERQEPLVNKYDFKYDQEGNITLKKWSVQDEVADSIQVVEETIITFNEDGFKESSTSELFSYNRPKKINSEYTFDIHGNLILFEKSTREFGRLTQRKIVFEYYDKNELPMSDVIGKIIDANFYEFRYLTCSTFSYACMHELVDQFSPRPILKRTPSRIREYIKVAEPNDWNLVSEHIFHFSTVN